MTECGGVFRGIGRGLIEATIGVVSSAADGVTFSAVSAAASLKLHCPGSRRRGRARFPRYRPRPH